MLNQITNRSLFMYLDIGVYNFDKRISLLMKTLYVKPVANAVYIQCYGNIFTGSRGGLTQSDPTSGLDNPPSNGGQSDGTHGVGAKNGYVNYNVWEE